MASLGVALQDLAQRALSALEVLARLEHLRQDVHAARIVGRGRAQAPGGRLGAGEIAGLPQRGGIQIQEQRLGVRLRGAGLAADRARRRPCRR